MRRRKRKELRFDRKHRKHINLKWIPEVFGWVFQIVLVCLCAFVFVWYFGHQISNIGESMNPVIRNGDVVLVNRIVYDASTPKRGDIIVFKPKGNENLHSYIKRIIGLPGESVEIRDGEIYVNNRKLVEKYETTAIADAGIASEKIVLGGDEYFVLGDNRESSEDSRMADIGNVKRSEIEGKVWFMNFQWYPGHMTKAKRMMQENIKLIDLVIELVDARVPMSSRNPDIDELGKNKARLILLNKADLADEKQTEEWIGYFRGKGYSAVKVNSRKGGGIKSIQGVIQEACKEKTERDRKRGILNRPVRAMVVGIPNVGKSTFINALAGKACAKTGNKPGVTKGKQWIRLNKNVELLDTPGILWPKFEDQQVGLRLAFIGSIKDEIMNLEELAAELISYMQDAYPGVLAEKYTINEKQNSYSVLEAIAESRHCLVRGNELDTAKAAGMLLDDFRNGRLGRITLEFVKEYTND